MLEASFKTAFHGIRKLLTEKMIVSSSGLLLLLQDNNVISEEDRHIVKVGARFFCMTFAIFL